MVQAIRYGLAFQFKITVIGDEASSMIVFIRKRRGRRHPETPLPKSDTV